jgi:hypothetical protein
VLTALGRTLRGEADAPAVRWADSGGSAADARTTTEDHDGRSGRLGRYILRTGSPAATEAVALVGSVSCSNPKARCLLACRNGMVAATRLTAQNTSAVRG